MPLPCRYHLPSASPAVCRHSSRLTAVRTPVPRVLQVYTCALTSHMVATLDAAGGRSLGGLDAFESGVWGAPGPTPSHAFEHTPWEGAALSRTNAPRQSRAFTAAAPEAPPSEGREGGGSGWASAASEGASGTFYEDHGDEGDDEGDECGREVDEAFEKEYDEEAGAAAVAMSHAAAGTAAVGAAGSGALHHPQPRRPAGPAPKRSRATAPGAASDAISAGDATGAGAVAAAPGAAEGRGSGSRSRQHGRIQGRGRGRSAGGGSGRAEPPGEADVGAESSSCALVAPGGTGTALIEPPAAGTSSSKKRSRRPPYPLRQPALRECERNDMETRRAHMEASGYTQTAPPELDPRIDHSLWPRDLWERTRARGTLHRDTFLLCHLCTEAALLRDPHVKLSPYWCAAAACGMPAGSVTAAAAAAAAEWTLPAWRPLCPLACRAPLGRTPGPHPWAAPLGRTPGPTPR